MIFNLVQIGARIRQVRGDKSGAAFGKMIGVSTNMVSLYEAGQSWPKAQTLARIIELSGKGADWLFYGQGESGGKSEERPAITYPLAEDEKNALATAENVIVRFGLDKRFFVAEKHQQPVAGEAMTEDERRLFRAYRGLDPGRRETVLAVAENMVLARKESHEKGCKAGDSMDQNCA